MILNDPAPSRISTPALIGAALLSLVAIPGWSASGSAVETSEKEPAVARRPTEFEVVLRDDEDKGESVRDAEEKPREEEAKVKALKRRKRLSSDAEEAAAIESKVADKAEELARKSEDVARKGEQIAREMEKKFGPGSEFQKKMEALGEEIEKKFGADSDFAREIEKKFGPGSDFQKKMEALGEEVERKFGAGSDFATEVKEQIESELAEGPVRRKFDFKVEKKDGDGPSSEVESPRTRRVVKSRKTEIARKSRARQIEEIERQLEQLSRRLRALQEEDADEDGEQDR